MSDLWATPPYIIDWVKQYYPLDLDVCALATNKKCDNFINAETTDSLTVPWHELGSCAWMNPPYSETGRWCKKALEESKYGIIVVGLLPSDTSSRWFHDYILGQAQIWLIKGRISFIDPDGSTTAWRSPTFGSLIAIWGAEPVIKSVERPPKPRGGAS